MPNAIQRKAIDRQKQAVGEKTGSDKTRDKSTWQEPTAPSPRGQVAAGTAERPTIGSADEGGASEGLAKPEVPKLDRLSAAVYIAGVRFSQTDTMINLTDRGPNQISGLEFFGALDRLTVAYHALCDTAQVMVDLRKRGQNCLRMCRKAASSTESADDAKHNLQSILRQLRGNLGEIFLTVPSGKDWFNLGCEIANGNWYDKKQPPLRGPVLRDWPSKPAWHVDHPELVNELLGRLGLGWGQVYASSSDVTPDEPWLKGLPDVLTGWANIEAGLQQLPFTAPPAVPVRVSVESTLNRPMPKKSSPARSGAKRGRKPDPERDEAILTRFEDSDETQDVIGKEFGITASAVSKALQRARKTRRTMAKNSIAGRE